MIPNYDPETGVHYGVISQHSLDQDTINDIWNDSEDLSFAYAKEELLTQLVTNLERETHEDIRRVLGGDLKDLWGEYYREEREEAISEIIEIGKDDRDALWEVVSNRFGDQYDGSDREWLWEAEGYKISNCLHSDMFVSLSPFFTYAPKCSPCVPNAGDLDSASRLEEAAPSLESDYAAAQLVAENRGWVRSYCLDSSFFEGNKAPYPVWGVCTLKPI